MSLECGECERDLRGPHAPSCSQYKPPARCGICDKLLVEDDFGLYCPTHGASSAEADPYAARSQHLHGDGDVQPLRITYRNWRGEVSERNIVPQSVWFGATEWHPEPQWLLSALDTDKGAARDFTLADFGANDDTWRTRALAAEAEVERLTAENETAVRRSAEWMRNRIAELARQTAANIIAESAGGPRHRRGYEAGRAAAFEIMARTILAVPLPANGAALPEGGKDAS